MPSFTKGPGSVRSPFGKNVYLRSTVGVQYESYTCSAAATPSETIDAIAQKILQPGEVIAKITSTAESGKVGVFQASVADGRQTLANVVGLNDTFLPWQLLEHDEQISVAYIATAMQAWCFERDASGARIVLSNTTAAGMFALKSLDVTFK